MQHQKKIVVGSLIIAIFVLAISITSWYVQMIIEEGMFCSCVVPLPILIPVLASVGLLIGTLLYYIFSPVPECTKNNTETVEIRKTFLKPFDETEKKIIETIADNQGELTQASIVSLTGISKVKVFRSLEKLNFKNIITKEKKGKTNTIALASDIKKILF